VAQTLDLVPNGSDIAVTRENRLQYIHLVSHYRLSKQIKLQSEAFFEGLMDMIDPKWIRFVFFFFALCCRQWVDLVLQDVQSARIADIAWRC
jgi:hypothetical protein